MSLDLLQVMWHFHEEQSVSTLVPHPLCTRQGPALCLLIINFIFFRFAFNVKALVHRGMTETLVPYCVLWKVSLCSLCVASGCVSSFLKV